MEEIRYIDYCPEYSYIIFNLHKKYKKEISSIRPDLEIEIDDSQYSNYIQLISNPKCKNKIAIVNETVVGYIISYPLTTCDPANYTVRTFGFLDEAYVIPNYRNRGITSNLIRLVIDEYQNEGIFDFELYVLYDNIIAKKLYHDLGFKTQSLRMEYNKKR